MLDAILGLTNVELTQIGAALRAGRLLPPYASLALQRYAAADRAAALVLNLQQLAEQGSTPDHLGLMLEALAADRSRHHCDQTQAELVWTGPEAQGTTNRDTRVVVRELFLSARSSVLVAGYAVYQGGQVFRALAENMDQNPALSVRMYLNIQRHPTDTSLASELVRRFALRFRQEQWPGQRLPAVYYDPRALEADSAKRASLHAKCIVVDHQTAFVSSANFTEAAQLRNIEAGALIKSPAFACSLVHQFESLVQAGYLLPAPALAPRDGP